MLSYQTTKQWITLLVFCSSACGWKDFSCGQTSHLLQGLKAPTFLLITCDYTWKDLGQINNQWFTMMWSNLLTFLNRTTILADQADVYTSVLFIKAFDTLLHDVLIWKAKRFRSGLPLISTKTSMNLGVQSSQETGKKKKILKKSSCHLLHSTSLRKKRQDRVCIWLKMYYKKKVLIPSSIASPFRGVPVMISSVEPA